MTGSTDVGARQSIRDESSFAGGCSKLDDLLALIASANSVGGPADDEAGDAVDLNRLLDLACRYFNCDLGVLRVVDGAGNRIEALGGSLAPLISEISLLDDPRLAPLRQNAKRNAEPAAVLMDAACAAPIANLELPLVCAVRGAMTYHGVLGFGHASGRKCSIDVRDPLVLQALANWLAARKDALATRQGLEETQRRLRDSKERYRLLQDRVRTMPHPSNGFGPQDPSSDELRHFAQIASHDLQEPLRRVIANCEILKEDHASELSEEGARVADFIQSGGRRLRLVINDLLAYIRVREQLDLAFEPVDMAAVLCHAMDEMRDQIALRDARIDAAHLPLVWGRAPLLKMVFRNLLSNAIAYGGERSPVIDIAVEDRGHVWRFAVTDRGVGVEPRFAERIFEIFRSLHNKDEREGSGAGLAICKLIIERCGGRIWLDRSYDRGARFFFTLPKSKPMAHYADPWTDQPLHAVAAP